MGHEEKGGVGGGVDGGGWGSCLRPCVGGGGGGGWGSCLQRCVGGGGWSSCLQPSPASQSVQQGTSNLHQPFCCGFFSLRNWEPCEEQQFWQLGNFVHAISKPLSFQDDDFSRVLLFWLNNCGCCFFLSQPPHPLIKMMPQTHCNWRVLHLARHWRHLHHSNHSQKELQAGTVQARALLLASLAVDLQFQSLSILLQIFKLQPTVLAKKILLGRIPLAVSIVESFKMTR